MVTGLVSPVPEHSSACSLPAIAAEGATALAVGTALEAARPAGRIVAAASWLSARLAEKVPLVHAVAVTVSPGWAWAGQLPEGLVAEASAAEAESAAAVESVGYAGAIVGASGAAGFAAATSPVSIAGPQQRLGSWPGNDPPYL